MPCMAFPQHYYFPSHTVYIRLYRPLYAMTKQRYELHTTHNELNGDKRGISVWMERKDKTCPWVCSPIYRLWQIWLLNCICQVIGTGLHFHHHCLQIIAEDFIAIPNIVRINITRPFFALSFSLFYCFSSSPCRPNRFSLFNHFCVISLSRMLIHVQCVAHCGTCTTCMKAPRPAPRQ